ncbi:hypothetical protein B0O99DRAFT_4441 [Bisporella sp. PMI_857]|nr:hypothetical protein B0O99DRAFT_4441 [Bisporella sp. PMI_857]
MDSEASSSSEDARPESPKTSRPVGVWGLHQKNYNYFNFVVCEHRPEYVPGSGPPMAPITPALEHDHKGYIVDKAFVEKELRYLVAFEDQPQLKVSVRPEDILNWVSSWAFEDWEHKEYKDRIKTEEEAKLARREARKQKKLDILSRAGSGTGAISTKVGRKRKRSPKPNNPRKKGVPGRRGRPPLIPILDPPSGPGRRHQPIVSALPAFTTLSSLSRKAGVGLADRARSVYGSDSDDDASISTSEALNVQLNSPVKYSSESESPDPLQGKPEGDAPKLLLAQGKVSGRSAGTPRPLPQGAAYAHAPAQSMPKSKGNAQQLPYSTIIRESMNGGVSNMPFLSSPQRKPQPPIRHDNAAVASTSSLEADSIFERLEREQKARAKSAQGTKPEIQQPHSKIFGISSASANYISPYSNPKSSAFVAASIPQKSSPRPPVLQVESGDDMEIAEFEDDEEQEEYSVDRILGEEMRLLNGEMVRHYHIQWEGDWDNTWEPEYNVGAGAKKTYEAEKRRISKQSEKLRAS